MVKSHCARSFKASSASHHCEPGACVSLIMCLCFSNNSQSACVSLIILFTDAPFSPTDKMFNIDVSPKPTMFLPSIAETNFHQAGTYLCLLENFFPEDIKVYWKEKDSNVILKSQQGDTMKTKDTYMKFSWLTVAGSSRAKEYKCVVKHEKNSGGVENEILFPSVNQGMYI